jgi:hypothetical protein
MNDVVQLHPEREPTHEHRGVWTPEMRETLRAEYVDARANGTLAELALRLGVDLYQLYGQAHRLGLSRMIRRR